MMTMGTMANGVTEMLSATEQIEFRASTKSNRQPQFQVGISWYHAV
jgi:hypothetical protein